MDWSPDSPLRNILALVAFIAIFAFAAWRMKH